MGGEAKRELCNRLFQRILHLTQAHPPHLATLPLAAVEMAHFEFKNVFIQGSTFNSAQGDLHVPGAYITSNNDLNMDPEFGMHNSQVRSKEDPYR